MPANGPAVGPADSFGPALEPYDTRRRAGANTKAERMLSQTAEYALKAVLHLAERADEQPITVDSIADALSIPRNYLSKIFHTLAKRDLLTSSRGPGGGFALAVPPQELSLLAVVEPFDQLERRAECLLGRPRCSDRNPCAAHGRWKELNDLVTAFFRQTTVYDLVRDAPPAAPAGGSAELAGAT